MGTHHRHRAKILAFGKVSAMAARSDERGRWGPILFLTAEVIVDRSSRLTARKDGSTIRTIGPLCAGNFVVRVLVRTLGLNRRVELPLRRCSPAIIMRS